MRPLNLDYIRMFAGERADLIDSVMGKVEAYPAAKLRKKTLSGWHANKAKKSRSQHPVDLERIQSCHHEEIAGLRDKVRRFSKSTMRLLTQLPADHEIYDLVSDSSESQIRRAFNVKSFIDDMSVGEINEALITFLSIERNPITRRVLDGNMDTRIQESVRAALKAIHNDATCVIHPSVVLFLVRRPDALERLEGYFLSHGKSHAEPMDHGHMEEYLSLETVTLGAGVL